MVDRARPKHKWILCDALRAMVYKAGSLGDVAARCWMTKSQLFAIVSGRHQPRPHTLKTILNAIGATEDDLVRKAFHMTRKKSKAGADA
jgi:DNA-binding phage protein